MKPYIQGELDGFCGIYSVINATKLVTGRVKEDEAIQLFGAIMTYLETYKKLSGTAIKGHYARDIEKILKHVIGPRFHIRYDRPFRVGKTPSQGVFFSCLEGFLNDTIKTAVIVYLEHEGWDHWSVITRVTPKTIEFFDSDNLTRISINRCVMKKGKKDSHYFFPARKCFVIWKDIKTKKARI